MSEILNFFYKVAQKMIQAHRIIISLVNLNNYELLL